ncbi:MAG: hypothetical protein LBO82_07780 [Synergistaceae bacterium]|jgi:hypothetical protein|nr:hypothetical protein [Synergistaceae bacterium]
MDDKGEIISFCDVDENLALQIWTKGLSPRVVILNKNRNKKKFVKLRWFEDLDRKLSINGKKRGVSIEYLLSDLLPPLQRILSEYAVYTAFKPCLWRFSVTFEKVLHAPAIVFDKKEFSLLPEEKRSRLWISDLTDEEKAKGDGLFRPFFPLSEAEEKTMPEGGMSFTASCCGVEDLFRTGVIRKLNGANPRRWHRPVRIAAAAMLLGFSFCEEDGEEFSDEIWRAGNFEKPLTFKLNDPQLKGLGRKLVGYIRHFDTLDTMSVWASLESDKELQDAGYVRKRRLSFPAGLLGSVETSVTFFEREDGMMALGCKPKIKTSSKGNGGLYYASPPQKSQEKQELIYTLPKDRYATALLRDAFTGAEDDYFTVGQLVGAKIFEAWSNNIVPFISYFAGFVDM